MYPLKCGSVPPGMGWVWWEGEDTPSAAALHPETFRLGRWTPAGRDHSSKHPTETESTSPEPSAYWSKLVTLGPTANTSERATDRQTDRRTHRFVLLSRVLFFNPWLIYSYIQYRYNYIHICVLPSAAGPGCRCGRRCCFQGACHPRHRPWQQQSLSGCR